MPAVIKKIDEKAWRTLKVEAARHGVTTGKMIEIAIREHVEREKKKGDAWKMILSRRKKPLITEKEAEKIKEAAKEFSKDFEFRV